MLMLNYVDADGDRQWTHGHLRDDADAELC